MAQYVVLKRKNHVMTLEAIRVNLKRAQMIARHPHDKYATYIIAELKETILPTYLNETGESFQETVDRESFLRSVPSGNVEVPRLECADSMCEEEGD